jgi:hypothetical protein
MGEAFLFALRCWGAARSLGRSKKLGPTRMGLRRDRPMMQDKVDLSGVTGWGPWFGAAPNRGWGSELGLGATLGRDAGDGSRTGIGSIYQRPEGLNGSSLLTGAKEFRTAEVEVYRVYDIHTRSSIHPAARQLEDYSMSLAFEPLSHAERVTHKAAAHAGEMGKRLIAAGASVGALVCSLMWHNV